MRTTLSIDDDVLEAVKARAHAEKKTAGAVVSELLRSGLRYPPTPGPDEFTVHDGFVVLPSRGGLVTNAMIDKIREDEGI